MAFATLADLFKNKPEVTEGMEDVARRSFPSKLSEYGNELTAEQLDALNNDPKLLEEFTKSKQSAAPKLDRIQNTGKSVSELINNETILDKKIRSDDLFQNIQRSSETPDISSKLTKPETGFQLGKSTPVEFPDASKLRLQQALKTQPGIPVGESYIPKDRFTQAIERLEPSTRMVAETPDISSKLTKMEDMAKQLQALPDEQLSTFGKLGEMIKNSRALKLAGKVAGPLSVGLEANAAAENLAEGKYPEVAGNALGVASGVAATMGNPVAAPLGIASLGIAGGMSQGRQQAESGVDEMGMESVPTDQTFSGSKRQLTPMEMETQAKGVPLANNMSAPPPTPPSLNGNGPVSNPNEYASTLPMGPLDNINRTSAMPMEEDVGEMGGDASMLVGKKSPTVNPNQEELNRLIAMQDTVGTLENLRAAQSQASDNRATADIMAAGAKFGSGLSGAISKLAPPKVDTELADNLRKDADRPVSNLKEQLEMEKDDPNSTYSTNLREFATKLAKQAGVILPANISGRQLASLIPGMESLYERSLKREELKQTQDALSKEKDTKSADKKSEDRNKRITKLNDRLTSEIASGRSVLGKAANIKRSAEAIERLINQYPDLNTMDNRQIKEVARNLDAMLSSSAATVSGTAGLIPSSSSGDMSKIEEYISNLPKGAKQGAFVKRMLETVVREKELAGEQIKSAQNKLLTGYQDLKGTPELDEVMEVHGLNPEVSKTKTEQPSSTKTNTAKPSAGQIVNIKGKRYRVKADGDSLEEI